MTYANGHTMKAVYNSIGQMVAEKWFETEAKAADSTATPIAHYKYVYDGDGNIVRSIDISGKKEYNYEYEEGRIVRSAEFDVTFDSEEEKNYVTSKTFKLQVLYIYNADGEMVKKIIRDADGDEQVYKYTNPEGSNPVMTLPTGVVSQSKNDKFGRKEFDELQLGRAFMYRKFTYHDGKLTGRNRSSENLKSTPTTNLVKEITLENGRTLEYEYDEEERITKVIDSVDGVTEYTYDAQGQLLTEQVTPVGVDQAIRTTVMTYDGYGNILTKTTSIRAVTDDTVTDDTVTDGTVADDTVTDDTVTDGTGADDTETNNNITTATDTYEYTCTWKDKLTAVNGVPIVYDNLGNPLSYLGHTLTWEKGRQLKSFDSNTYTYNANGIRTSKTVGGVKHTYSLDGTKILKETWGDCTLIPLYDNEDSVCGIIYDDAPYYFYKNLQGDIIEITNKMGSVVARYTYDAWGKVIAITDEDGFDVSANAAHVANANPFRYRGYYYDAEIGMYYLQSRYYDPSVGRFINGDDVIFSVENTTITQSFNIFCYCNNDPINRIDENGYNFKNKLLNIIKSLGFKAFTLLRDATKMFLGAICTGKLPCSILAIIIDTLINLLIPALPKVAQKVLKVLLSYKSINKDMAKVLLNKVKDGIVKALALIGVSIGLNVAFTTFVNGFFEFNISRFLTIGGIICFLLDWADGIIDMWIDLPQIGKRIAGVFS